MQEILIKVRHFERGLSKSLINGNFIFSFKPSPFQQSKLSKTKRDLELVTSRYSGYETSSEKSLY